MNPKVIWKHIDLVLLGAGLLASFAYVLFSHLVHTKEATSRGVCVNHLKAIGLALRIGYDDHQKQFPSNATNNTDTKPALRRRNLNSLDEHSPAWWQSYSNELQTTEVLICPSDTQRRPGNDFQHLGPENVTYRIRFRTNSGDSSPEEVLTRCPIHGYALFGDGVIRLEKKH